MISTIVLNDIGLDYHINQSLKHVQWLAKQQWTFKNLHMPCSLALTLCMLVVHGQLGFSIHIQ